MSRKGNCLDNSLAENFFGLLKSELFYMKEYKNIEELENDIIVVPNQKMSNFLGSVQKALPFIINNSSLIISISSLVDSCFPLCN